MQVSANGVISLGAAFNYYSPRSFPQLTRDIIAPFWDYYYGGKVLYRLSDNQTLLSEVGSTINDALVNECDFTPTMLLIATWNNIPGYRYRNAVS